MKRLRLLFLVIIALSCHAFAQIGNANKDLVFTPTVPCRIFDTRTSQGGTGSIEAAGTKNFAVRGVSSFVSQGGEASNCGLNVGNNIAAIAINITVITPAAGGYITAYPSDQFKPLASTVNFKAGDVLGNASVVKVSQDGGLSGTQLSIFSTASTDVAGDVVGFYSKPVVTALECLVVPGTLTAIPAGSLGTTAAPPSCPANYFNTASYCNTFAFETILAGFNNAVCSFRNPGATATFVRHDINCCRIPGRAPLPPLS